MDGKNLFDAFEFQYHLLTDDYVHLVSTIKLQTFVRNRQIDLPFKHQTTQMQLMAQAFFVG